MIQVIILEKIYVFNNPIYKLEKISILDNLIIGSDKDQSKKVVGQG